MELVRYSPDQLLQHYRQVRQASSQLAFFTNPAHKKTQELWCAAHFGRAYCFAFEPCYIWISDRDEQTDTDFQLELPAGVFDFQISEVQLPSRRRGDEYRRGDALPSSVEHYDQGDTLGPIWVRDRIEAKRSKYGDTRSLNLLIYLNFPARNQLYTDLASTCRTSSESFASVWLLNGNSICCIRRNPLLAFVEGWALVPESLSELGS